MPHLFPSLFFPPSSISLSSILSPFRLHSVFLHVPLSSPFFLSFHPIPVFSLLVPTSRHHFPFSYTISSQILRNFLCHTPLTHLVLPRFFDSLPSSLLVGNFVPFTQLYIHPFSFCSQSFHFFTGSISLSPSPPCSLTFLSSIPSVSCTLPFHPFCPQTLPLSFSLSLST
jgi:hypothetical protein